MLKRHEPSPPVDWADEASVKTWIEHVRWSAFFNGARGDEISQAEAKALVAALAQKDTNSTDFGR
jgi:hypothetical protein